MSGSRLTPSERTACLLRQIVTVTPTEGEPYVHETMQPLWQTALAQTPDREPLASESWIRGTSGFAGSDDAPTRMSYEKYVSFVFIVADRRHPNGRISFMIALLIPGAPVRTLWDSMTLLIRQDDLQISRLPGHQLISPSTLDGIHTPVHVQHRLVFRCLYMIQGRARQLSVSKAFELSSCVRSRIAASLLTIQRETLRNLYLPSYVIA